MEGERRLTSLQQAEAGVQRQLLLRYCLLWDSWLVQKALKGLSSYQITCINHGPDSSRLPMWSAHHSDHQRRTWDHEERVKGFPALACSIHCLFYFTAWALLRSGVDFTQLDNKGRAIKGTFRNIARIGIIGSHGLYPLLVFRISYHPSKESFGFKWLWLVRQGLSEKV